MVLFIFIIWRSILFGLAAFSQSAVPYLGFFPYKEILTDFHLPAWASSFANFDGLHYILVSQQGYSQFEQAYFPLYPLLMSCLNTLTKNALLSGLIISNVSFFMGLLILRKLYFRLFPSEKKDSLWVVLFILVFPTSFFFGSVYTEGFFFFLVVFSLYSLQTKKYVYAAIAAALASSTRLMGIFLFIPFFTHVFRNDILFTVKKYWYILAAPLLGFLAYGGYLWFSVGDPLFFFHAQPAFGANRSTSIVLLPQVYYRYVKIILTAAHDYRWYVSLLEVSMFTVALIFLFIDLRAQLKKNIHKNMLLGINLFSCINIILPTMTGTFSSIPRYLLFSFSLFFICSRIRPVWVRVCMLGVFVLLQFLLLALFIQGYFIG